MRAAAPRGSHARARSRPHWPRSAFPPTWAGFEAGASPPSPREPRYPSASWGSSPAFTEDETPRMATSPAGSSGASPSPAPSWCPPVAPILRGAGSAPMQGAERWVQGGSRGSSLPGASARGQSRVPAPTKLARAQPCSLLFFPLQLVGFLINSQISFGHRSWGWKKLCLKLILQISTGHRKPAPGAPGLPITEEEGSCLRGRATTLMCSRSYSFIS